jgi:hypothetical protein
MWDQKKGRRPVQKERIMNSPHRQPTRDQQIFTLGLDVEAVSLYLLCCGLVDAGQPLTLASITPIWNLDRPALVTHLKVLMRQGILMADGHVEDEGTRFQLRPSSGWGL